MKDCIPALFDLTHRREPYCPNSPTERADSDDILGCFRALHAFRLGLDLGLSICRDADTP